MPCDTIRVTTVKFGKNTDIDIMMKALKSLGHTVSKDRSGNLRFAKWGDSGSFNPNTGEMTVRVGFDMGELKREYSKEVVNSQAEKNGWEIDWTTNESGNPQATVVRRNY